MGYEQTIGKAWNDLSGLSSEKRLSAKLLSDIYDIDVDKKTVSSNSCNVPAKDYVVIIILHYLIRKLKLKALPVASGEWIDFNQIEGGQGYYPAFKKRTIDRVVKKYGYAPEAILKIGDRLPAKRYNKGDAGIVIYPFDEVPVLITIWKEDDEFGPEANILFDRNISSIFCAEDIVVLTEMIAHSI
ncbi:MAG: DUF3786 domain-containing protein [Candidatus Omnitrophota bacterium]|nr:DUF3786 domain-containing protein [Candidatus Omnitrophota bacterium]